jgi:preprotein translocase subunit SecF
VEFFKKKTSIPFMRQRKWAAVFSALLFIASLWALASEGLNLGLDFTGGTQISVNFTESVDVNQIREELQTAGFEQIIVQAYSPRELSIRIAPLKDMTQENLKTRLLIVMPSATIAEINYIGPEVGKSLMTNGILAIVVSLIAIMIYIALRFDYRFAISAAVALIHDPVLILGVFSFFHLEFNLIVLAAVLTVIGYSLNDTIVVYDRVRENFCKIRKGSPTDIMDLSINETLSRTIMTSGLTLLVVLALFIFGGAMIHNFALALIIGIVIGTYSSIYIAGSLAVALGLNRASLIPVNKKLEDQLP